MSGTARRGRWIVGLVAVLILALVLGGWFWLRSDAARISAATRGLSGVDSSEVETSEDRPGSTLRLTLEPGSSAEEVQAALETAQRVLDDELTTSARVSRGTAETRLASRYGTRLDDAAAALMHLATLPEGHVLLDETTVIFSGTEASPLLSIDGWLAAIEESGLGPTELEAQDAEGWNALRVSPPGETTGPALAALRGSATSIDAVQIDGAWVQIRAHVPFEEIGPLAEEARAAARLLDADTSSARVETSDGRALSIVDDDDPAETLALAAEIDGETWQVTEIGTNLAALNITAADDRGLSPAELPALADRLDAVGLPADSQVRVDDGALFQGGTADLIELAPAIAEAAGEGFVVRWIRDERGTGYDSRIEVELPEGRELSQPEDLSAAITVARSVPWPGTGSITISEDGSQGRALQIVSTAAGAAEDVQVDPERLPGEDQVREAWDATAG